MFSCQQKLLLPTDSTDNTKFFFSQQITLITQIIFREIRCFYNHQTNQMNQTTHCASHPVHRVHLVTKKKKELRDIRVIRWQKKDHQVHRVHLVTKIKTSVKSVHSDVNIKIRIYRKKET